MADKEEIRSRSDIVEIVGSFVPLKKKGRNYLALCPFHQEKTPSFNVDPVTQSFKCFGCSASGDVFTFVERYENMTFVEAAEFLARRAGLTFDRKGGEADPVKLGERDRLYALNLFVLEWFRKMLERNELAREYLQKRGLVHDTIRKFQLGYAPEGWNSLVGYLQSRKYDMATAVAAGLAHPGKMGDHYDVFRHRIIFPIHDEQDRVVGFGGRAFGDEQPKYLNTGETPVFIKSRLLYGLPFARRKIASENRTLLMEGYMDVIAAHQAGFTNAVATLGTSLTEDHARKLARLAPTVVLVYDADNAGIKATLRSSEILEKEGIEVRVVRLPKGEDPDSLLKRDEGAFLFQKAVDDATARVEYLIEYAAGRRDLGTDDGRLGFLSDIYRILADVESASVCDHYLEKYVNIHPIAKHGVLPAISRMRQELDEKRRKLRARIRKTSAKAEESGIGTQTGNAEQQSVRMEIRHRDTWPKTREEREQLEKVRFRRQIKPVTEAPASATQDERAELELIRAMAEPDWRTFVLKRASAEDFTTQVGKRFYAFLKENPDLVLVDESELVRLLATGEDDDFSSAIRQRLQEFHALMANVPISEAVITECIDRLRQSRKNILKRELSQLLQSKPVLTVEDRERARELTRILQELTGPG